MSKKKIVVKTYSNSDIKPLHFCIIDADLATQHMQKYDLNYDTFLAKIEIWALQDFNIHLLNHNTASVKAFKSALKQAIYKPLSQDLPEEMLSWNLINAWISNHMRKELEISE